MATSVLSGVAFGAALTASGVHHPSIILGQLKLANWDMMETFLTATASSTFLISAFHAADIVKLSPRCYSPLGLFAHYDGNIVGGALLGVGMALTSSCPGTVLAQIGAGMSSGYPALAGALLGGLVWTGHVRPWLCRRRGALPHSKEPTRSVHESLGINQHVAAVVFEGAMAAAVAALMALSAGRSDDGPLASRRILRPVIGGSLIGLAQLASLVLRSSAVGVSTAYEEVGDLFWWPLEEKEEKKRPPRLSALTFAGGVVAGAWAISLLGLPPALTYGLPASEPLLPAWQSVLGGFVMVMGARIAGGCTSGHGITGMSLLSLSSFVTIGSALAAGVFTAKLFL